MWVRSRRVDRAEVFYACPGYSAHRRGARGMSMVQFAASLGNNSSIGRPVRDTTGLMGTFDFHIEFAIAPPSGANAPPGAASADLQTTLFTALQEQLGLKLQAGVAAPVDVLVIDQASRPTAN